MVKKIVFENSTPPLQVPPVSDRTDGDTGQRTIRVQIRDFGRSVVEGGWMNLFRKRHRDSQTALDSSKLPLKSSLSWPQTRHKNKIFKGIFFYP